MKPNNNNFGILKNMAYTHLKFLVVFYLGIKCWLLLYFYTLV